MVDLADLVQQEEPATMRFSLKRLILAVGIFSVLTIFFFHIYLYSHRKTKRRKGITGDFIVKKTEIIMDKPGDIFWNRMSGVKRKKMNSDTLSHDVFHNSEGVKYFDKSSMQDSATKETVEKDFEFFGSEKTPYAFAKLLNVSSFHQNVNNEVRFENDKLQEIRVENAMDSAQISMDATMKKFNMNIQYSDLIALNREVPDSRPKGCVDLVYPDELPGVTVVIPFHNEWPSVLLRTVHSLVNRTPAHLLEGIVLVDDASDLKILERRLENYLEWTFPEGLVKLIRLPIREGLIRARLEGLRLVTSEVVSFFDSHMEVNHDWLQPLVHEIVKNKHTIAMAQLDYIDNYNLKYNFYEGYRTRYGFKWDMQFFETYFRPDDLEGAKETDPLPGVLMVGAGFVINTEYFKHIGAYDNGMKIWGGENIELALRTWMCGGKLVHVPCSRIGHIERYQPYSFPEGRINTELYNYKRTAEVWMGEYKQYVFNMYPEMANMDVGSLAERKVLRARLKCRKFDWFLKTIWPELLPYKKDVQIWGKVKTFHGNACLSNGNYLFQAAVPLVVKTCNEDIESQGFSLMKDSRLRTTLHCVIAQEEGLDLVPYIESCFRHQPQLWKYENQNLIHIESGLCLQVMTQGALLLQGCQNHLKVQRWIFTPEKIFS